MDERGSNTDRAAHSDQVGIVVLLGISGFFLSTVRFSAQSSSQTFLQRQGTLVLDEMARKIRPAFQLLAKLKANAVCMNNQVPAAESVDGRVLEIDNGASSPCFYLSDNRLCENSGGGCRDLLAGSPVPLQALILIADSSCKTLKTEPPSLIKRRRKTPGFS